MQYCSLQHQTLLPSPVISTTGCWFCFDSISSFSLGLFLHCSPVASWAPTDLGEFTFQCPIFLPFHTVHGFLKARILKWFAIPFSSGSDFVRIYGLCGDYYGDGVYRAWELRVDGWLNLCYQNTEWFTTFSFWTSHNTSNTEYSKLRTLDNELKNISKGHLVYPSQHNTFPTHQKIRALAYPLLSTGI